MKIAIYGAGKCGEYVAKELQLNKNIKVRCDLFIDNNPELFGKQKFGIPIINLDDFINGYSKNVDNVLIAVSNWSAVQEMVISLLRHNYIHIYLMPESVFNGRLPILNREGEFISYIKFFHDYQPSLPYLEYHVSDFCNLKCKGCGHFSNRVTEKIFPDIEEFEESLTGLKVKFKNIKNFRLMGGEPLVNPNLSKFIYMAKSYFPYADLKVVTNGLLLPQINTEVIKAIRDCNVVVDISQYPPTRNMIEDIVNFTERNQIPICIGKEITQFMKQMCSSINNNFERAHRRCISKGCHFLRKKRLYPCPEVSLLYENRDFFEVNITKEMLECNSFDLVDGKENGWEILESIIKPFEFCRYCSTEVAWFDWSHSGIINKEDWMVDKRDKRND